MPETDSDYQLVFGGRFGKCPAIRSVAYQLNAGSWWRNDEERTTSLSPLIDRIVAAVSIDRLFPRACLCLDRTARVIVPMVLDLAQMHASAKEFRNLPPLASKSSVDLLVSIASPTKTHALNAYVDARIASDTNFQKGRDAHESANISIARSIYAAATRDDLSAAIFNSASGALEAVIRSANSVLAAASATQQTDLTQNAAEDAAVLAGIATSLVWEAVKFAEGPSFRQSGTSGSAVREPLRQLLIDLCDGSPMPPQWDPAGADNWRGTD